MTDYTRKLYFLLLILASGLLIFLFALNVTELWGVWLLTIGFFFGSALAPRMERNGVVICTLAVVAIVATLISRRLPIYTLDWRFADRVEISDLGETWKVVLSDPQEITELMKYGESGHYRSMIKSGTNLMLMVTRGATNTRYYVHGDSIGHLPGGAGQTVFVPERDGLLMSLHALLARHGHDK